MQIISTDQHNTHHEEDSRMLLELWQRPLLLPPLTSGARNCRNATSFSKFETISITRSNSYSHLIIRIAEEVRPDNGKRVFVLRERNKEQMQPWCSKDVLCDGFSVMNSSIETRYNNFHFTIRRFPWSFSEKHALLLLFPPHKSERNREVVRLSGVDNLSYCKWRHFLNLLQERPNELHKHAHRD